MNHSLDSYYLIRLSFETAVRFGDGRSMGSGSANSSMSSDSFYSALLSETVRQEGKDSLEKVIDLISQDQFLASSLLPYYINDKKYKYFLPRPLLPNKLKSKHNPGNSSAKKVLKKVPYISNDEMISYLDFISQGIGEATDFTDHLMNRPVPIEYEHVNLRDEEDSLPYTVAAYKFAKHNSGLYCLLYMQDKKTKEWLIRTLDCLADTGLGGKKSSGLGKFEYELVPLSKDVETKKLWYLINNDVADYYMSLGNIIPSTDSDFATLQSENSAYLLNVIDGFASSINAQTGRDKGNLFKRKSFVALQAGSCFEKPLIGSIVDLSSRQDHPVYRIGKTIQVGLIYE